LAKHGLTVEDRSIVIHIVAIPSQNWYPVGICGTCKASTVQLVQIYCTEVVVYSLKNCYNLRQPRQAESVNIVVI